MIFEVTAVNYREQREDDLIRFAREGDENAYTELMRRSWEICMHAALCRLGNREDARDEVQNAFWKAYAHLHTFQQQCKFSTWVTRIAINGCLMRQREKIHLARQTAVDSSGQEHTMHEAIDSENPEGLLGDAELRALVRHELSRIPLLLRVPVELRYMRGMELHEIAGRLNISLAAAKSRLHRGHRYLKDRMLKHCGARGMGTLTRAA